MLNPALEAKPRPRVTSRPMEDLAFTSRAFKISPTSTILSSSDFFRVQLVTRIMDHLWRHLGIWEQGFVKAEENSIGKRHFEGEGKHTIVCLTYHLRYFQVFVKPKLQFCLKLQSSNNDTSPWTSRPLALITPLLRPQTENTGNTGTVTTCPNSIIQLSSL